MGGKRSQSWFSDLRRPTEGRLVAGVCAGLAEKLDLEVTLLRLAFMLLSFASGLGVILYLVFWILVPPSGAELPPWRSYRDLIRYNFSGMRRELRRSTGFFAEIWHREGRGWPRPLSRRWIALALIIVGGFILLYSLGVFSWLGPGRSLGLALVIVGVSIMVRKNHGSRSYR